MQPFIRNHQYNLIKKQVGLLQNTCTTVADPKIVESVRSNMQFKLTEAFPEASEAARDLILRGAELGTAPEFQLYLASLESCRIAFEPGTEQQLKKLYPKIKKLKLPDLDAIDWKAISYLGWSDIAANKLFIVYPLDGRLIGIEGRFTPTNKKGTCFVCNRQTEVGLFTALTKSRPANASPDYYKAIGNYMCADSVVCNGNITDPAPLEQFLSSLVK
ncbi:FusB/FusC family EF-G-binding protein [Cohnella sp. GbtcB17]|uniref:FusB/FusC family EF-G-binding protein n=1 Tax=Cohnella sp. GbtcB17 TaxID=2824762 RepID=UPI001C2F5466|nr:FusB/FusC family EF-G-binding protein [Cohnella sp. GbtcB17]